ncbi:MAG: LytTR family DNA-binding domain-containing protein [Chitinophagaceae bacterium]
MDYLLKPISFERFLKATQKAYNQIQAENRLVSSGEPASSVIADSSPAHDFIFVKTEYRMRKIRHAEILLIEGGKEYITIYTATEKIMSLASLSKLLENLPYPQFMRVHKSYIVALDKIDSIERQRIFIGTQVIPIGDTYKDEFIKQIGGI